MKKFFGVSVIAALLVLGATGYLYAEDSKGGCGVEQMESLGGDEYMTDSGEIEQMEDIGEGEKMSDSGEIYQDYGSGDGDLATSSGGLVSVDE